MVFVLEAVGYDPPRQELHVRFLLVAGSKGGFFGNVVKPNGSTREL